MTMFATIFPCWNCFRGFVTFSGKPDVEGEASWLWSKRWSLVPVNWLCLPLLTVLLSSARLLTNFVMTHPGRHMLESCKMIFSFLVLLGARIGLFDVTTNKSNPFDSFQGKTSPLPIGFSLPSFQISLNKLVWNMLGRFLHGVACITHVQPGKISH